MMHFSHKITQFHMEIFSELWHQWASLAFPVAGMIWTFVFRIVVSLSIINKQMPEVVAIYSVKFIFFIL